MKNRNTKSIFENCLDDFAIWLGENSNVNSEDGKNSYKSYIRRTFDLLNEKYGNSFVNIVDDNKGEDDDKGGWQLIEKLLIKMIHDTDDVKKKSKRQDYLSGYRLFEEFLSSSKNKDLYRISFSEKANKKISKIKSEDLSFTKDEMKNIFKERIKSQDRKVTSKDDINVLMYPIRLITKIFSGSKEYNKKYQLFLENEIDNIEFIIKDKKLEKRIPFKDIESLTISSNKCIVSIETNGKKHDVYTKRDSEKELRKLIAIYGPRDVSIDHNNTMDTILTRISNSEEKKNYKKLARLTEMIVEYKIEDREIKDTSKIATNVYEKYKSEFNVDFCDKLLKELENISQEVGGLTIKSQSDNASDGNKVD